MRVKALQSIGKWLPQGVIEVIADAEFDKLVKAGKADNVLSQSRADELAEYGAVEVIESDEPKPKTPTRTTTKSAETKGE